MKSQQLGVIAALLIFAGSASFAIQSNSETKAIKHRNSTQQSEHDGITRQQADVIIEELRQIHRLLESDPQETETTGKPTKLQMKIPPDSFAMGREDAPLTLVEFMDYQCLFCRRFHEEVFSELKKQYIDTGKIRFISLDLPLGFHANALLAAEAARCAGDQGKYWEMREDLLLHADKLDADGLRKYAEARGLKVDVFRACMESEKYKSAIQNQARQASSLSIEGTPTFVLARTAKELTGEIIFGARPYSFFDSKIKETLELSPAASNVEGQHE